MTSQRPRVLILVENLPVPFDRRVWQEACALRDAGYDVTVICPRMRGYTQAEEILDGIQIYRHWITSEAKTTLGFLFEYTSALVGEFWCLLKALRHGRFDIIHLCNPPDLLFLVALPFKLLCGSKIIFDVHDLWPEMFAAKFGARGIFYHAVKLAERCTLAIADVVIATNQSVLNAVRHRGHLDADCAFIVRTAPSNLDTSTPSDDSLRCGKKHLVGYIGVMGDADGVDYLLEAARHIVHASERTDVHFLLMGSGPEYDTLVAHRDLLCLRDHVTMPGRVSDTYLCTALQTIDLGIACDPMNTYSDHCTMNKVLEYMSFAKPIVMFATVEGRYSAGDAASYVLENSATKLGDAILAMLDDPARREKMGHAGHHRFATELNWQKSTEQLCLAYARCLPAK